MALSLVYTVILALLAFTGTRLFVDYRRLSSAGIPGPFLASFSNFYRAYYYWNGHLNRKIKALHSEHGHLVRVGPNHVSISDPDAVPIVYGTAPTLNKSITYRPLQGFKDGRNVPSIISTLDENQDTSIRRGIGGAFSPSIVHEYEHHVDKSVEDFVAALTKNKKIELSEFLQFYTADVISRVAFSSAPGFLVHGEDVGGSIKTVDRYFARWLRWTPFPELESLLFRNRFAGWLFGGGTSAMGSLAMSRLRDREVAVQKGSKGERDLLQRYMEAMQKFPDSIDRNAVIGFNISTFAAGSDTTASTLTALFYYILHNTKVLAKLHDELQNVVTGETLTSKIPYTSLSQLPYLDATIKESMRIFPAIGFRLERVVPSPGLEICGTLLPTGTIIDCDMRSIHNNEDVFGADTSSFKPERWLEASLNGRRKMERSLLTFGSGKRMCIGNHIAIMEIKKLVAAFVLGFDMELQDPHVDIGLRPTAISFPDRLFVTFQPKR